MRSDNLARSYAVANYNRHHTTENVACQKTNAQFQEGENAVTQNNINGGDRPNQRQQVRCEPSTFHQNCKNMSKHFFHHSRELNVHAAVKPTDDKICILSTKKSKEIHLFDPKSKIHAALQPPDDKICSYQQKIKMLL